MKFVAPKRSIVRLPSLIRFMFFFFFVFSFLLFGGIFSPLNSILRRIYGNGNKLSAAMWKCCACTKRYQAVIKATWHLRCIIEQHKMRLWWKLRCILHRKPNVRKTIRIYCRILWMIFVSLFSSDRVACMWRDGSRINPFSANANEIQLDSMNCCKCCRFAKFMD